MSMDKYGRALLPLFAICAAVALSALVTHSQAAGLEVDWAIRAGGDGADKIRGIDLADDGAIFATGEYGQPSADFLGEEVQSAGLLDFVVAKFSPDGSLVWLATAGGAKIDRGYGVAANDDGGCFVTGHFESAEIDFGNSQVLKSRGDYDTFVARYDAAGKCLWAIGCGGAGYDYGHGIDVDHAGGCVVSGAFAATGHFGDTVLEHANGRRAFVMRVAANGDLLWIRESGSEDGSASGHNVCCDGDGNVFLAGLQRGGATFSDKVLLADSKIQDVFVARYNLQGDCDWAFGTGGKSDGLATSVAPDGSGGCYIGGMFQGELTMAGAAVASSGGHDAFAAHIDSAGVGLWVQQSGGAGTDYGLAIAVAGDGSKGCLLTGELSGAVTFRGKGSERDIVTKGERDSFIAAYSPDGELRFLEMIGGDDHDLSYAIAADDKGTVVISGAFRNLTTMGNVELTSRKGNDIFLTRLKEK